MEQKCANCRNGKWRDGVTPITDTCIKCRYVDKGALRTQPSNWEPKEQTNADRIRAMSDEELAEVLRIDVCCPDEHIKICGSFDSCNECWVAWLQQPAKGE